MTQAQRTLPVNTLKSLSIEIGKLPAGDSPKAWWMSTHPEVLRSYDSYKARRNQWDNTYRELLDELGLPYDTQFMNHARVHFAGIVPPKGVTIPRWLRKDRDGIWVPRKRTQAEKTSKVQLAFEALDEIPQPNEMVPGMPDSIHTEDAIYQVHVRRPGKAVLAFLGVDPDFAIEPFEVGEQWSTMKLSTFHLLREFQSQ